MNIGKSAKYLYKKIFPMQDVDKGRVMKWVGLTGGIATGKSTVRKILSDLNAVVIDADQVSHDLTLANAEGYAGIVSQFGTDFLNPDQSLNRRKLGELVFSQPAELAKLEAILHPLIQKEVKARKQALAQKGVTIAFYDVPLLFEKNLQKQFDHVVLVYAPITTQVERIMLRNNLTHTEALARIHAQIPITDKVHRADFCLDNSTNTEDLKLQVVNMYQRLT
jgi:dephospho-CoA kinase